MPALTSSVRFATVAQKITSLINFFQRSSVNAMHLSVEQEKAPENYRLSNVNCSIAYCIFAAWKQIDKKKLVVLFKKT